MQTFDRTSTLNTVYTAAQVRALLADQVVQESFSIRRISGGVFFDISPYVDSQSVSISHDSTREIKRSASLTIRGDAGLDWYNDYIQIVYQLGTAVANEWLEFVVGTFVPLVPARRGGNDGTWREITVADFGQLLKDSRVVQPYFLPAGISYASAAIMCANEAYPWMQFLASKLSTVLPSSFSWDAGTPRLQIINDLLMAGGYQTLWFDEMGVGRVYPLTDYSAYQPSYTFDGTSQPTNVMSAEYMDTPDLTKAANQFLVKGEDPRRGAFYGYYENNSGLSKISTVNYRKKLEVIDGSDIADPVTALLIAKDRAQQVAWEYDPFDITTSAWPVSQHRDIYGATWNNPDDGYQSGIFLETAWDMECFPGGRTDHHMLQIVGPV